MVIAVFFFCYFVATSIATAEPPLDAPFDLTLPCEQLFERFKDLYSKTYPTSAAELTALRTFCKALDVLRMARDDPASGALLGVTPMMDGVASGKNSATKRLTPDPANLSLKHTVSNNQTAAQPNPLTGTSGATYPCITKRLIDDSIITVPSDLPEAVDFREVGLVTTAQSQGSCGSCYVQAAVAALESLTLRGNYDLGGLSRLLGKEPRPQPDNEWRSYTSENLSLSVQYFLDWDAGGNFCAGGDSDYVLVDLVRSLGSVETYDRCPYRVSSAGEVTKPETGYIPCPKRVSDYFNPMQLFGVSEPLDGGAATVRSESECPGYYGELVAADDFILSSSASADHRLRGSRDEFILKIKSLLAQGIPVVSSLSLTNGVSGGLDELRFSMYRGGIFRASKCSALYSNHQTLFCGYGTITEAAGKGAKKTEVWILKNSWGDQWGDRGFYYIPIGEDTLCHERLASFSFPHGFNASAQTIFPAFEDPILRETLFQHTPFYGRLKRCVNGLDIPTSEGGCPSRLSENVAGIAIFCVYGISLTVYVVFMGCVYLCRRPRYPTIEEGEVIEIVPDDYYTKLSIAKFEKRQRLALLLGGWMCLKRRGRSGPSAKCNGGNELANKTDTVATCPQSVREKAMAEETLLSHSNPAKGKKLARGGVVTVKEVRRGRECASIESQPEIWPTGPGNTEPARITDRETAKEGWNAPGPSLIGEGPSRPEDSRSSDTEDGPVDGAPPGYYLRRACRGNQGIY